MSGAATWEGWLALWRMHGETSAFKARLRAAVDIAGQGYDRGAMFGALSGGKDGCALAGVLAAAGMAAKLPLVHCHTELNTPGMEECALATAEKLDMDLEIIEPDLDVWAFLRGLPLDIPIWDESNHLKMRNAFASGNMLVAHQYAGNYDGSYSGMRADESRGRRMNRKIRGPLYQIKKDGSWMCLPIVDWSARDVFAWCVRLDLPIHPHYRLLFERCGVSPESPSSRVDCMIPEDRVTPWPIGAQVRLLYPDLWRKLLAVRPELSMRA